MAYKTFNTAHTVTPSDTNGFPTTRALYIGVSGDLTVDFGNGSSGILLKAVPVGLLEIGVDKVYSTGTTAQQIVALY